MINAKAFSYDCKASHKYLLGRRILGDLRKCIIGEKYFYPEIT
jgi:hypothetical protein